MNYQLSLYDYVIIIFLLSISAAIGIYFRFTGGRQRTVDEFLMGGKKMKPVPVAFSLMATYMSAIALLGVPADIYMYGTQYALYSFGLGIGGLIVTYGFLPVYFDLGINTSYEYLEKRFGKTTRTVVSFLFIIQMIFYLAVVLYAPSAALNAITGLPIWVTVLSMAGVSTFYCSLGGMKAVLWTDLFQSILMYTTVVAVITGGTYVIGFLEVFTVANDGGRLIIFNFSVDMTERYTFLNTIISGIYFGMTGYGSSQTEIQRILSTGKLKKGQLSLIISIFLIIAFYLVCVWTGLVLFAIYKECDPMLNAVSHLQSPDQMIPYTIMKLFSELPGLPGLCIAGIFSASLSTISSAVNSLTSVTVEDFLKPYCRSSCSKDSTLACVAKSLAIVYGGFCLLLTFMIANFSGLIQATNVMFGMIGGPTLGIFLIGLFCKNANQPGALCGLFAGCALSAWAGFGSYIAKIETLSLSRSISECAEAFNETSNISYLYNNVSLYIDSKITVNTIHHEEKYVFPLYKMAFLWIPVLGCLTVVILGILFSLIFSLCRKKTEVHPKKLSPFVRKLYFRSRKKVLNSTISQTNLIMKMDNLQQQNTS